MHAPRTADASLQVAPAAGAAAGRVVNATRILALGLTVALILLGLAWELGLAPTGRGTLAVKVLPLALALPGLLRHRMYTHRWLSLLVWVYVAEGLVRATTEQGLSQWLAAAEVVLGVALFAVSAWHVRARLAHGAPNGPV
jgi:uncharacterized membrane protein